MARLAAGGGPLRALAREPLAPAMQQSLSQRAVSALGNEELDDRIEALLHALPSMAAGSAEHTAASGNLKLLEDEVDSRGYYSPVIAREGLVGAVAELLPKVDAVEQQLGGLFAGSFRNQGGMNLFKKDFATDAQKQLDWIRLAANQ